MHPNKIRYASQNGHRSISSGAYILDRPHSKPASILASIMLQKQTGTNSGSGRMVAVMNRTAASWLTAAYEEFRQIQKTDLLGAEEPNATAIENARRVLENLRVRNLRPNKITVAAEGGVVFVFTKSDRYADIECGNDGEMLSMKYSASRKPKAEFFCESELASTVDSISAFIR